MEYRKLGNTGVVVSNLALGTMYFGSETSEEEAFGARTVKQLHDNLGATDLHLPAEAMATLDAVSRPPVGGYPYGAFGSGQRARSIDGSHALQAVVAKGSDAPLGRR